ncbi:ATP-binding protein [bacterium]|nr:ATP-binding protein [bacterium]
MLLRFGARNFFSFKEGVDISLELGASCPLDISRGKAVTNLLCVKGANGSGKTNILKILSFLQYFCCTSFKELKPEDKIMVDSFFYNDDPVYFFCEFISDGIKYLYEVSLNQNEILTEKVTRKIKQPSVLFERVGSKLKKRIKEFSGLDSVKLRKNASLISSAYHYDTDCIKPIYNFFDSIHSNVAWHGRIDHSQDFKKSSELYFKHPEIFGKAKEFIIKSDLGVSDIIIREATDEKGELFYFPVFKHDVKDAKNNLLAYHSQSLGTKTIYNTIWFYIIALLDGGVLVADEFDIDFHPDLLPKFISYFDNDKYNKNNAQMIFSTHNAKILDYTKKYRSVLVNKDACESYAYRLDEIPGDIIRNGRSLVSIYNSGKIGGVPRI